MNTRPRYNVQISPVRDITLAGTADLSFWQQRLREQDLAAAAQDGKAQLWLIAVDAKFMGLGFRELSIAVSVCEPGGGEPIGVYLPHAFNSSRMFAFVERNFYHTPYYRGNIRVQAQLPAGFEVSLAEGVVLSAEMSADSSPATRKPLASDEDAWEGPILLPRWGPRDAGKMFFARLRGHTDTYSFAAHDTLLLKPTPQAPIIEWLAESEFSPHQWAIRLAATHARTKSVAKSSVPLVPAGQPG